MRKYAWIFVIALLLSACSARPSFARTPEEERPPLQYVCMENTFFNGSIMETFYKSTYTLEDCYEDEKLQEMVSSVKLDYPIDTQADIHTMAWVLYDIGVAAELIDPELKPSSAERYAEGIWHFAFNKVQKPGTYYDGDQLSFLISGEDGHIITLRTEMMFLDPHGPSSWSIYNGSDNLAPGERPAILRISWLNKPYEDKFYPIEEWSSEDSFEDERWQDIAASVEAEYPLIEESQITDWAWAFQERAAEKVLMKSWHKPWYATHYNNGIWELIFETGTWKAPMGGARIFVLISDLDGHVIHVEERS